MTTQELMNALHPLAVGLRTPEVLVYDEKGNEYEIVRVYEEDDFTCIDLKANEGTTPEGRA